MVKTWHREPVLPLAGDDAGSRPLPALPFSPSRVCQSSCLWRLPRRLRSLVHLLKYQGMQPIAGPLGALLADILEPFAPAPMLVIPVPMHAAKQRQRGYNHAELLARAAMAEMRRRHPQWVLHLETSLLRRVRVTVSQAGLTTHQRRQNLRGAFFAPKSARLAGQDVLLVDDIYTTGATVRACSRVLMNAGARSVRVATVARAQREGVALWDTGFLRTEQE